MTYEQLLAIAQKQGTVRWTKSGIVEQLDLTKKGVILARLVGQAEAHRIRGPKKLPDGAVWDYACVEVDAPKETNS